MVDDRSWAPRLRALVDPKRPLGRPVPALGEGPPFALPRSNSLEHVTRPLRVRCLQVDDEREVAARTPGPGAPEICPLRVGRVPVAETPQGWARGFIVTPMPTERSALESLVDPRRRRVLEELARRPGTAAALASALSAPPAILDDLLVQLSGTGLVRTEGGGQETAYSVDLERVLALRDFLDRVARLGAAEVSGIPVPRGSAPPRFVVRREVDVGRPQADAFELFAAAMGGWWPLGTHHLGTAAAVDLVLEPGAGGRWYERGDDGTETSWGQVLMWDPPRRLVLGWNVGSGWRREPQNYTEIVVAFLPTSERSTLVRLEHRGSRLRPGEAARLQATFDGEQGWNQLLRQYAESGELRRD